MTVFTHIPGNITQLKKWLYCDYSLISNFMIDYVKDHKKIDLDNEEIQIPDDGFFAMFLYYKNVNDNYDDYKTYFISIVDQNINSIYDFEQKDIEKLKKMKDRVYIWFTETHRNIDTSLVQGATVTLGDSTSLHIQVGGQTYRTHQIDNGLFSRRNHREGSQDDVEIREYLYRMTCQNVLPLAGRQVQLGAQLL